MKLNSFLQVAPATLAILLGVIHLPARAATFYVATNGNDGAAGTSWATAKRTIQAAVDLTSPNDTVLVSNGTYSSGVTVTPGHIVSNRVVITNSVTVQSLNGPALTSIVGTNNGDTFSSVRCVFITAGTLAGFTLRGGYAPNIGPGTDFEAAGGGAYALGGTLTNCILTGNGAAGRGGGSYGGTLDRCTLTANSAYQGGGSHGGTLDRCMLTSNTALLAGGGSFTGKLNNCILVGNSAGFDGGGSFRSVMNNCTLTGNSAAQTGGGAAYVVANNCIIYFNSAPTTANYRVLSAGLITHTCTTPLPAGSSGNITNQPFFIATNDYRLATNSPCINAGTNALAPASPDLDGNPRIMNGTVDMGAYESLPLLTVTAAGGSASGGGYHTPGSNVVISATHYRHWFFTQWNDGDTNRTRTIVMPLTNISYTAVFTQAVGAITWYVATSGDDAAVGTSWASAKQTIQAGVDETLAGDTVLVSNGTYFTGSTVTPGFLLSNRVVITNNITVQSVNGPGATVIDGAWDYPYSNHVRCVYISQGFLSGFTLIRGTTLTLGDSVHERSGGGAWAAGGTLSNCVINECGAYGSGGGAYAGTLVDCTLNRNFASGLGGGAYESTLYNCTLHRNTADGGGGGSYGGTLFNCTLSGNTAYSSGGGSKEGMLFNCLLVTNVARTIGGGGGGSHRGTLIGCTLSNNVVIANDLYTLRGGGAYEGTLINCLLVDNKVFAFPSIGGGANGSRLYNCVVTRNSADVGGGVYAGVGMYNCTIVGNTASDSYGGIGACAPHNCIVYFNSAPVDPNYDINAPFAYRYSCVTPLPTNSASTNNITSDPQFVNAAALDFRLRSSSPCIDAGNNVYATNLTDFVGNPRIIHGTVDMGAHEFQGYWAWAAAITNAMTNATDSATADGYLNLLKYATGSSPTNADELARLAAAFTNGLFTALFNRNTNATDITLLLERSDSLTNGAPWTAIATNQQGTWNGATNIIETTGSNPAAVTLLETTPATNRFHRLRVTKP